MTEQEIHTLTGAYAADALPEDERIAFAAHLDTCPWCAQEVLELTATTARLATAATAQAPADMRARVLAEIQTVRQLSPQRAVSVSVIGRSRSGPWYQQPVALAASFLLFLCLGLAAVALSADRHADQADLAAARIAAVATDPNRKTFDAPINNGGKATLVAANGDVVLRVEGMSALPANRTYQLWVMDGHGGARSVAVLGRGTSGHLEQFVPGVLATDRIGVTVEPRGGSKQPTTPPVMQLSTSA